MVVRGPTATLEEELMLAARLSGPLSYDDPNLLHMGTRSFLHPPSTLPYHLVRDQKHNIKTVQYNLYEGDGSYIFYKNVVHDLFKGAPPGFFVEAGALDGEFLSNTLSLEKESGWTGLLVETDGDMFKQLLQKRRRSWASHTCLATQAHPHLATLVKYLHQAQFDPFTNFAARARSLLINVSPGTALEMSEVGYRIYESVQCLPLATLLLAINVTHVDMVSLDVEGAEVDILRYFPWDRFTIDVWLVEHEIRTPNSIRSAILSSLMSPLATQRASKSLISMEKSPHSSERERIDEEFVNMFFEH
ncbi:uncharacterized protein [Cherax quadricarinatus]|uniref:uncharacterized protein n=1 Tax=Cherax quadricarinatus TaxID=27406 RepID=UPI00387E8E75